MPETAEVLPERVKAKVTLWEEPIEVHRTELPVLRGHGILEAVDGVPEKKPDAPAAKAAAAPNANAAAKAAGKEN